MKVRYFPDTDTLHIQLRDAGVAETREVDENTLFDIDGEGNVCGITIEHAKRNANAPMFSYEESPVSTFR